MSSPFGLGNPGGPPPPPPPPPRRVSPLIGALIALAVIVIAAVLVWTVQAIRRQPEVTPSTTEAPPATDATPTSEPTGTTLPSSGRRTDDGAVLSSCRPYQQAFPLQPLGCTVLSPPNIKEGERLPLVVMLHGFNVSVGQEMSAGDWDAAVVGDRFIVVFPESNFSSWNAGGCCGLSQSTGVNDIAYLHKIVTDAKARPEVDPSRVFMVGNSNGGMMTYRYACEHSDELAGAVSVEGTRVAGCTPKTPLSFLHVAARDDGVVPYLGGQSLTSWVLGVTFPPVRSSVEELATASGCGPEPSTDTVGSVTREVWSGCAGGVTVELASLADWGHRWPTSKDFPATAEVVSFLGLDR